MLLRYVVLAALLHAAASLQPLVWLGRWAAIRAPAGVSPLFGQFSGEVRSVNPLDVAAEAYEVRLPRPLGLSIELGPGNVVAVVKVSGNAEKAGVQVSVGVASEHTAHGLSIAGDLRLLRVTSFACVR
jgi:hypothetical protein